MTEFASKEETIPWQERREHSSPEELWGSARPAVATLGPATRLVAVEAMAAELGISRRETREWLEQIGVPVLEIAGRPHVHLVYLETALWWLSRPQALRKSIQQSAVPAEALMDRFLLEIRQAGEVYGGMKGHIIKRRLLNLLARTKDVVRTTRKPRHLEEREL